MNEELSNPVQLEVVPVLGQVLMRVSSKQDSKTLTSASFLWIAIDSFLLRSPPKEGSIGNTQAFAVSFRESSAHTTPYWNDPFTIQDGHYVDHDGFIVRSSFSEFYERFPKYVADWVANRTRGTSSEAEADDWTQELLMFLSALPSDSVHRKGGKQDVIQTFSPERMHGANEARFRSVINRCLSNKFNTLYREWRHRPLSNPANLPLAVECEDGAHDEFCHANSTFLRARERRNRERDERQLRLGEFLLLGESRNSGLRQFVMAFRETGNWEETAQRFGFRTGDSFRRRVRSLAKVLSRPLPQ